MNTSDRSRGAAALRFCVLDKKNTNVKKNAGTKRTMDPYKKKEWTALAFGIGVDRVASLKFGISDIRLEYENDARFLKQF